MKITNSPTFCLNPANKSSFSTVMYGRIFHSFGISYSFCNVFSSETACVLQADRILINIALQSAIFYFLHQNLVQQNLCIRRSVAGIFHACFVGYKVNLSLVTLRVRCAEQCF
jgi:hypothetical protein